MAEREGGARVAAKSAEPRWRGLVSAGFLALSAVVEAPVALLSIFLGDDPSRPRLLTAVLFDVLFYYPLGAVLLAALGTALFWSRRERSARGVLLVGWIWGGAILALVASMIMLFFVQKAFR